MSAKTPKKARTHQRIVGQAARLLREVGPNGLAVDVVMGAAGLTRGGFYAHFEDKRALVAEALREVFHDTGRLALGDGTKQGRAWLEAFVTAYLSRDHVDNPGKGCGLPALAGEMRQADPELRQAFTEGVRQLFRMGQQQLGTRTHVAERRALATIAMLVGAVSLARALTDRDLADGLLAACREQILNETWRDLGRD